jgi:drug/metabolite transporter (DMT)-like permease
VLAVLLSLAAAAGFGASDYCGGLAARRASVIRTTILTEVATVAVVAVVLPVAGLHEPSAASLTWGAVSGGVGALGALALFAGFRDASFSVAGPLSAVSAAGFSVVAGLLLGERPGGLALAGMALALPAILGVSASPAGPAEAPGVRNAPGHQPEAGHPRVHTPRHARGVLLGLAAGACFATLLVGLNLAGSRSGLWPVAAAQVAALAVVAVIGAVTGDLHLPEAGAWRLATLTGITGGGGTILYFVATHAGLLAVTAVLTSLYPVVTIVLARLLLGERLTAVRLAGLCLAGAAVSLIAVGGPG